MPQYGPFEWGWILGGTFTSEEHIYFKWMSEDLLKTLKACHPLPYYYGTLPLAALPQADQVQEFIDGSVSPVTFYDSGVLIDDALKGRLFPLVSALRSLRVLYVGPDFLRGLGKMGIFPPAGYVAVPEVNAYLVKDRVRADIDRKLKTGKPYEAIGFSCGPLAPVLIHELWSEDVGIPMLDFGSLWDVYFGRASREYMQGLTAAIRRANVNA